jgi:hypothetical protein
MTRTVKFSAGNRGISQVLSSLLLTVVAVAAMAIATSATYVITTNMRETISERVIVEDVWFNNLTSSTDIYLRNVGEAAVSISAVYVNYTSQYFPKPFILEIGEHGWLNISQTWAPTSLLYIDILTTRGTHVAAYYNVP